MLVRIGIASSVPWSSLGMRLVGETGDGEAAWRVGQEERPQLVIMAIRMPRLDGVGLLTRIRAEKMPCSVIVITNVESGQQIDAVRRMGISKILMKAVLTQEDIIAAVREVRGEILAWSGEKEPEPLEQVRTDSLGGGAVALQSLSQVRQAPSGLLSVWIGAGVKEPLKQSLIQMIVHQLGRPDNFFCLPTGTGAVLLARRALEGEDVPRKLQQIRNYIEVNFSIRARMVWQSALGEDAPLKACVERAERCMVEEKYFDSAPLRFNSSGMPDFPGLDAQMNQFARLAVLRPEIADLFSAYEDLGAAVLSGWAATERWGRRVLAMLEDDAGGFRELGELLNRVSAAIGRRAEAMSEGISDKIRASLDYIADHLGEDLSVQRLADEAGYHPVYFSNRFKKETGVSYSEYLTRLRVVQAMPLLGRTNLPVQEIAVRCGFTDLPYFSNKFKRIVGVPPGQWRIDRNEKA